MLNKKEKSIVEEFYNSLSKIANKEVKLIWESGFIIGVFDTCFDDFSENDETDAYTSFAFNIIQTEGNVPVEISEDNYCVINYHNFPLRIEM